MLVTGKTVGSVYCDLEKFYLDMIDMLNADATDAELRKAIYRYKHMPEAACENPASADVIRGVAADMEEGVCGRLLEAFNSDSAVTWKYAVCIRDFVVIGVRQLYGLMIGAYSEYVASERVLAKAAVGLMDVAWRHLTTTPATDKVDITKAAIGNAIGENKLGIVQPPYNLIEGYEYAY